MSGYVPEVSSLHSKQGYEHTGKTETYLAGRQRTVATVGSETRSSSAESQIGSV